MPLKTSHCKPGLAIGLGLAFILLAGLPLWESKRLGEPPCFQGEPLVLPWRLGGGSGQPTVRPEPLPGIILARAPAQASRARPGLAGKAATEGYRPRGYYSGDPLPPSTIYLSFDDGPWDFTGNILDVLEAEGVRATFFINSYDKDNPAHGDPSANILVRYAGVLRRMVDGGHAIGNHSYSHQDFASLGRGRIEFQLDTLERDLRAVLGDRTPALRLIRPPFGSPWLGTWNSPQQQEAVGRVLEKRGLVMMWTTGWDSGDSANWAPGEWYERGAPATTPAAPYTRRRSAASSTGS